MPHAHPVLPPRIDDRDLSRAASEQYLLRQSVGQAKAVPAPGRRLRTTARALAQALPGRRHRGPHAAGQHP